MTNSLVTIIGVILIIIAVLINVPWRRIIIHYFGNSPFKARIYVEAGEQCDAVPGRLDYQSDKGSVYVYRWANMNCSVIVPHTYSWSFLNGRRRIRVIAGQGIASPLRPEDIMVQTGEQPQVGAMDLDAVIRSKLAVALVKSLFAKKVGNWLMIIIIVGALVIGYYLYNNNMIPGISGPEPQPAVPQTAPAGTGPIPPELLEGSK